MFKLNNKFLKIIFLLILFTCLISIKNLCYASGFHNFENAPRMNITINNKNFDDVTIKFTDYSGLDSSNIKFYEVTNGKIGKEISNDKNFIKKIEPKYNIEQKYSDDKTLIIQYIYTISNKYLNQKTNYFYVSVADNGNSDCYFHSYFKISALKKRYKLDLSPRTGSFSTNGETLTFDACDFNGVGYVKIYDMYGKNPSQVVYEQKDLAKGHTKISFSLDKFAKIGGKYKLKIICEDRNKDQTLKSEKVICFSTKLSYKDAHTELDITNLNIKASGDAILLSSKNKHLLMDTGVSDDSDMSKYYWGIKKGQNQVIQELKKLNVKKLDIYLSHWHNDHFDMIDNILKDNYFSVSTIYLPEFTYMDNNKKALNVDRKRLKRYDDSGNKIANPTDTVVYNIYEDALTNYTRIKKLAKEKNIKIIYLKKGSFFNLGDAEIKIIGPTSWSAYGANVNNYSLVSMIKVGKVKYLSPGDIEEEAEQSLLNSNINLSADILKLAHHGINTSNTTNFLKKINPKYVFITRNDSIKQNIISFGEKHAIKNLSSLKANLYGRLSNGNLTFSIRDNTITVNMEKNYYTIKVNYIDSNTNSIISTSKYKFHISCKDKYNTNDTYFSKYYLYDVKKEIKGYKYDNEKNKNLKLSGNALKSGNTKTINVYYKK